MYKLSTSITSDPSRTIIRIADTVFIPMATGNTDYQQFLDDINEQGNEIVDGDIPEHVLAEAAIKKFNYQLAQYSNATARLAKRDLSVTVPAVVEETVIGYQHNDVTGLSKAVVETVTVTEEIPAEPATITVEDEQIANPVLVKDQEERAAAEAIQAATPPDVVTAYENSLKT